MLADTYLADDNVLNRREEPGRAAAQLSTTSSGPYFQSWRGMGSEPERQGWPRKCQSLAAPKALGVCKCVGHGAVCTLCWDNTLAGLKEVQRSNINWMIGGCHFSPSHRPIMCRNFRSFQAFDPTAAVCSAGGQGNFLGDRPLQYHHQQPSVIWTLIGLNLEPGRRG